MAIKDDNLMRGLKEATKPGPLGQPQETVQTPPAEQDGGARQPATPTFESEADIDAYISRMMEADAKADRERDEQRLQRQMAARSLSDMGGVITDMIKASQGARVDPRQVEKHYQQLDDNARKVYDAYRTRMDLARKIAADGAKGDLRRRQGLADKAEDRAFQLDLWNRQRKAREADAEADRKARLRIANITHGYGGGNWKDDKTYAIDFRGDVGNLEWKERDGAPIYGRILKYLIDNKYIQAKDVYRKDKNGATIFPTNKEIRSIVDYHLRYLLEDEAERARIYLIATGDNRLWNEYIAKQPPTPLLSNYGAGQTTPSWQWVQIPGEQPAQPTGGTKPQNQTSSGSLY